MKRRRRHKRRNGSWKRSEFARKLNRFPKRGRKLFSRFWGVKTPPALNEMPDVPGIPKHLVSLGISPAVTVADGTKRNHSRVFRIVRRGTLAATPDGKRMFILTGKAPKKKGTRYIGRISQTEYIPHAGIEKSGSFKKGRHWVHEMGEEGGEWPKAYQDDAKNILYARGSYRIGKWIRN